MHYTSSRKLLRVCAGLVAGALSIGGCRGSDQPPVTITAADSADQVIFGLDHFVTRDGVRRARVRARKAYFYENSQTAELDSMTVTFFSPEGAETSTLTADEGTYYWRTSDMEARGNVVAITPDGRRLRTSIMKYFSARNQIEGPAPFVFDAPDRHLEGQGFTSDPDFKEVVTKNPKGTLGQVELDRR